MLKTKSLLLSVVLCCTMIVSACSSNSNTKTSTNETTNPIDQAAGNQETGLSKPGELPISKEKLEISVLIPQNASIIDINNNEQTKWLEEQTNIHVNWKLIPSNTPDELHQSLNVMLASGDYPDVIMGMDINDVQEAQYGVDQKIFVGLKKYIDNDMPNFQKVLEAYPNLKGKMTATDGEIYSLPSLNECYHCEYSEKMWINQDWLKKLNLSMPTTTDEFENVLKAFKTQDPNGNNKADEIPLIGAIDGWNSEIPPFLLNAFILDPSMYNKDKMVLKDNKIVDMSVEPAYKEGLKYLSKLYKEGLIYQASFTQKADQMRQMLANKDGGIVGVFASGASVIDIDSTKNQAAYKQYAVLPPLKGPDGIARTPVYDDLGDIGEFVITNKAKNIEAIARWADFMYSDDFQNRRSGVEGIAWRKATEGEVGLDGKPALTKALIPYTSEPQNAGWHDMGIEYYTNAHRIGGAVETGKDIYDPANSEKLLYEETKNKMEPAASKDYKVLPTIRLTVDETQVLTSIRVELEKAISDFRVHAIVTDGFVDKNWDSYLSNLDKIGLQKFLDTYQNAYDRQYGAK